MVGSAIVRQLLQSGVRPESLVLKTHTELDLTNQAVVQAFFASDKPTQVYLAAAKVGGIHANNTYPADFIYQNLMVQANVIEAAFQNGVQKLLFLGSPQSSTWPKLHNVSTSELNGNRGDYPSKGDGTLFRDDDLVGRKEVLH